MPSIIFCVVRLLCVRVCVTSLSRLGVASISKNQDYPLPPLDAPNTLQYIMVGALINQSDCARLC